MSEGGLLTRASARLSFHVTQRAHPLRIAPASSPVAAHKRRQPAHV